jgi:hypothetical protein
VQASGITLGRNIHIQHLGQAIRITTTDQPDGHEKAKNKKLTFIDGKYIYRANPAAMHFPK